MGSNWNQLHYNNSFFTGSLVPLALRANHAAPRDSSWNGPFQSNLQGSLDIAHSHLKGTSNNNKSNPKYFFIIVSDLVNIVHDTV